MFPGNPGVGTVEADDQGRYQEYGSQDLDPALAVLTMIPVSIGV